MLCCLYSRPQPTCHPLWTTMKKATCQIGSARSTLWLALRQRLLVHQSVQTMTRPQTKRMMTKTILKRRKTKMPRQKLLVRATLIRQALTEKATPRSYQTPNSLMMSYRLPRRDQVQRSLHKPSPLQRPQRRSKSKCLPRLTSRPRMRSLSET